MFVQSHPRDYSTYISDHKAGHGLPLLPLVGEDIRSYSWANRLWYSRHRLALLVVARSVTQKAHEISECHDDVADIGCLEAIRFAKMFEFVGVAANF